MSSTIAPKLTAVEKRAEIAAQAKAERIAEYRAQILKKAARRLYTKEARHAAFLAGDFSGEALEQAIRDRDRAIADIRTAAERLERTARELLNGIAPGGYLHEPNSAVSAGTDALVAYTRVKTLKDSIAWSAYIGGWRLREFESPQEQAKGDTIAGLMVVTGNGGWIVWRKVAPGPADGQDTAVNPPFGLQILNDAGCWAGPTETAAVYPTEDAAWQAIHLVLEGSPIAAW